MADVPSWAAWCSQCESYYSTEASPNGCPNPECSPSRWVSKDNPKIAVLREMHFEWLDTEGRYVEVVSYDIDTTFDNAFLDGRVTVTTDRDHHQTTTLGAFCQTYTPMVRRTAWERIMAS